MSGRDRARERFAASAARAIESKDTKPHRQPPGDLDPRGRRAPAAVNDQDREAAPLVAHVKMGTVR
jgi:hypothetical protein